MKPEQPFSNPAGESDEESPLGPFSRRAARPCFVSSSSAPADSRYRDGEVVGARYRLTKFIGRGSMGEVWDAEHVHLKSRVAIKFFVDPFHDDPERARVALERFQFEAQVSARLAAKTAHIVPVHDADVHAKGPFLVMERVEGESLDALIAREGPLSIERVANIVRQIADAMDAAHAEGIVHRDLKPSNILIVNKDGHDLVKVADFGVAKAVDVSSNLDRPRQTQRGFVVGTPNYMSPEQVTGGRVDAFADRWALAVVAYEALTTRLPFEAPTHHQRMFAITTKSHEHPSKLNRELGPAVDSWFNKALSKRREYRFATTLDLVSTFSSLVASPDQPAQAIAHGEPEGMTASTSAPRTRGSALGTLAVLLVLVFAFGAVTVLHVAGDMGPARVSQHGGAIPLAGQALDAAPEANHRDDPAPAATPVPTVVVKALAPPSAAPASRPRSGAATVLPGATAQPDSSNALYDALPEEALVEAETASSER